MHPTRPFVSVTALILLSSLALHAAVPLAGTPEVQKIVETFEGRGVMRDNTQPLAPADALKSFTLRDGLAIDLIAAEPDVRQPVHLSFDSRGRMWVTQYLQYPFPAGVKVMSYDFHLRAVFDKVPEPPPRGARGADKVTVFEDQDGDGTYESHRDVITGLNIATAALKGAGGIWVLNPPYLLFYPDANDDDVPEGDPVVKLSGFGLEDTHSVAAALQFGPDGWIYGATGSTTTGRVSSRVTKDVAFVGQHIWRFDPRTDVFEIFAEGGGNTFSCEIDAQGRVFSGTNGSQRGMHFDQGMHGSKNFGKHGTPANPYAFGYFDHMVTRGDTRRFTQVLVVYDGDQLAPQFAGKIIAPSSMLNRIMVSQRLPDTSTFQAVDEDPLLTTRDRWFRPVDIKVGPDGAIYVADWYDTRLSHVSPVDDWSKADGRLYRIRSASTSPRREKFDLHTAAPSVLVGYLKHPNKWFRRQAALELSWRGAKETLPALEPLARDPANAYAFDAVCAIDLLGGLRDDLASDLLQHPDPYVRRWVVRAAGDDREAGVGLVASVVDLAKREAQPEVRTQLLATARRLPATSALPIARAMLGHEADAADKRMPLMFWWTLEARAESDRAGLLRFFQDPAVWRQPLARTFGAHHLAQRWAMAGGPENFAACAQLLALAPRPEDRALVVTGLSDAFVGGKIPTLPPVLATALEAHIAAQLDTDLALGVKTGNAGAVAKALAVIRDETATVANRIALVQAFAEAGNRDVVPAVLQVFNRPANAAVRQGILTHATRFDDPALPTAVLKGYEARFSQTQPLKESAHRMLASRRDWAKLFLAEVEKSEIKPREVSADVVRQLALHRDPDIDRLVRRLWPVAGLTLSSQEKAAEAQRIKQVIATPGDTAKGQAIFAQRCGTCHTLHDTGGTIGPNLVGYERGNPDFWLRAILEPSAEIREGFGAYVAQLKDGRTLFGVLTQQDAGNVVLQDLAGQKQTARTADVEKLEALPQSLMPESTLGGLDEAGLRDLFAYLMRP